MPNRREFLKGLAATTGGLALLRSSNAFAKNLAIPLDKAEKLKAVGGSAVLKIKDMTILFVRDSDTSIRALDPVCTHLQCMVAYDNQTKRIECPCHGSKFDLNGEVINGPAKKALKVYQASLSGDRILVEV